ncbi:MAG: DUF5659 domain-containing protein [Thermodesulfovibrionales bacterium]
MKKAEQKTFETLDLYLSSFLALSGMTPRLELINGKVIFVFDVSNKLYELMRDFNSNDPVFVTDFVTMIKMMRGKMLSMRSQR